MIVYQIQNKITGKIYIGYSTKYNSEEELQKSSYFGSGIYIKNAIRKYGNNNFERKVLVKNIFNFKDLEQYENIWIKKKNSIDPNGYNLRDGGLGGQPNPSDATKEKLKKSHLGKKQSEETKIKISKAHKGKILSKEHRKNISKAKKGILFSEEHLKNLSKNHADFKGENSPNFGRKVSEEQKQKQRERMTGERNPNFGRTGEKHPLFGKTPWNKGLKFKNDSTRCLSGL